MLEQDFQFSYCVQHNIQGTKWFSLLLLLVHSPDPSHSLKNAKAYDRYLAPEHHAHLRIEATRYLDLNLYMIDCEVSRYSSTIGTTK